MNITNKINEIGKKVNCRKFCCKISIGKFSQKNHIAAVFVKMTDFDNKVKKLNKKVTSNKTKYVLKYDKVCVLNKTEDLNLSIFNMITGINESKTLTKYIP